MKTMDEVLGELENIAVDEKNFNKDQRDLAESIIDWITETD